MRKSCTCGWPEISGSEIICSTGFTLLAADLVPYRLRFQAALGGVGQMVNHNPQPLGLITIHAAEG